MAEMVPMEHVQGMWDDMGENRSWAALAGVARQHTEQGMSDEAADQVESVADNMENTGAAFPSSAQDLYNMLNQGMGGAEEI